MFLAVDSELFGSFVIWIIQDIVTLRVPSKQVLILYTVCKQANGIKPLQSHLAVDLVVDLIVDLGLGAAIRLTLCPLDSCSNYFY